MNTSGPRTYFIITALLAALCPLLAGTAAAAPATMIVLSSAAYDVASETAGGIATDPDENVYVTGVSDNGVGVKDIHSVKYSKSLVQGPVKVFSNGNGDNLAKGIAVDGLGNIVIVGRVTALAQQDFLAIKYSPNFAAMLSSAVFDGGFYDEADAVGVDSQNNIFITGYSSDGTSSNFYTIKYGPALNQIASAFYDGGNIDQAAAIVVDHSDNIVVAGFSRIGATNDFFVRKYNNSLNTLYSASFNGGGDDRATGVAVDSADNIIVTGRIYDGVATYNYCTLKYDAFLNFISSAVYDSGSANNDIPAGVAVDQDDNIIVAGQYGAGGITENYFTIKYDRNFIVISSAIYDGGNTDKPAGVAIDASGNTLVTGASYNGVTSDYFTIKYNSSPRIKEVSPLFIGETANVTIKGNGFLDSSSVTFPTSGISTGTIAYIPGQLTVSVTLSPSVLLGPTPITVLNVNGESVTNSALALTQLRSAIGAGAAGTLTAQTTAGPVSVSIPAGTFPVGETVTIFTVPPAIGDARQVGQAIQLNVSPANVPLQNITVKLPYLVSDLGTYPETGLSIAYFDSVLGWQSLPSSVNTTLKTVSAAAKQAGTKYAVVKVSEGVGIPTPGTPGSLGGGKVYPNPYRPGSGGYFDQSAMGDGIVFAELGAGQSVKLTIVDVAGRLVFTKSGMADADGKFFWNAKTASGGIAASGVYLYSITGAKPRKGKFSIIR